MEQPQQRSKSMVFVLVVSAILLAVATFLTIILITSRSSPPDRPVNIQDLTPERQIMTINVNGVPVILDTDPGKTIFLEGETITEFDGSTGQAVPPTLTPTPPPPPPTPTPPPTPRPDSIIFIDYTVMAGDTLYSIANAQNSSVALMARHGHDANDLTPGNIMRDLPVANPAYCSQGSRPYVVRDNDTVFRIAAHFGKTVEAIARLNNLDENYRIEMTQVICIPA